MNKKEHQHVTGTNTQTLIKFMFQQLSPQVGISKRANKTLQLKIVRIQLQRVQTIRARQTLPGVGESASHGAPPSPTSLPAKLDRITAFGRRRTTVGTLIILAKSGATQWTQPRDGSIVKFRTAGNVSVLPCCCDTTGSCSI